MTEAEICNLFDEIETKLTRAEELTDIIDSNLSGYVQEAA